MIHTPHTFTFDDRSKDLTTLLSGTSDVMSLVEEFNHAHFISSLIKLPIGGEVVYFPFDTRPHLVDIVTSPYPNQVWIFGRQTGKSSLLAATDLAFVNLNRYVTVLYLSPTLEQTKRFSLDRLREMIRHSDLLNHLKAGVRSQVVDNVFEQEFPVTQSKILMRYALRTADRVRGYTSDVLDIDEAQDMLSDVIEVANEVIEQSIWKIRRLIGTPKDFGTPLQRAWDASTQNEWAVPCHRCGITKGPNRGPHWSIVETVKSIGKEGLLCEKCGKLINTLEGRWIQFRKRTNDHQYEGFRFPQPSLYRGPAQHASFYYKTMIKGMQDELLTTEVLALPSTLAEETVTEEMLTKSCTRRISLVHPPSREIIHTMDGVLAGHHPVYVGIDWMGGNKSYTSLAAGIPLPNRKLAVVAWKIFTGAERGRIAEMRWILNFLEKARVVMVLADVGNGIDRNPDILNLLGPSRFKTIRYNDVLKYEFLWKLYENEYQAHREKLLAAVINCIQRQQLYEFPPIAELKAAGLDRHAYALKKKIRRTGGNNNTYSSESVYYDHAEDDPDDAMQALAYMTAAFFLSPQCGPDNPWMPYTLKFGK